MKKVHISVSDRYLSRRLQLILEGDFELTEDKRGAELLITDAAEGRGIVMRGERDMILPLPAPTEAIRSAAAEVLSGKRLRLLFEERAAVLDGERIRLTELEAALLDLLIKAKDFVSKDRIRAEIFGASSDSGIVNVYIHYLREKLERSSLRIILSSRKLGYRINEEFTGGERYADAD